jgi:hypothetical protein
MNTTINAEDPAQLFFDNGYCEKLEWLACWYHLWPWQTVFVHLLVKATQTHRHKTETVFFISSWDWRCKQVL